MATWQTPVITWVASNGVAYTDFNRIEGNIQWLYDNYAPIASPSFTGTVTSAGGITMNSGYFTIGAYSSSYGTGSLQSYYNATAAQWIITNAGINMTGNLIATGTGQFGAAGSGSQVMISNTSTLTNSGKFTQLSTSAGTVAGISGNLLTINDYGRANIVAFDLSGNIGTAGYITASQNSSFGDSTNGFIFLRNDPARTYIEGANGALNGPRDIRLTGYNGAANSISTNNSILDDSTGKATFGGLVTAPTFDSTVATGTAPFTVASTTQVNNLNTQYVNGYSFNQALQTTSSPSFSGITLGTASITGNGTISGGTLVFNNSNSNKIRMSNAGVGPQGNSGTLSAGTKFLLWDDGNYAYGIGIDTQTTWYSSGVNHRWYSFNGSDGTAGSVPTSVMTLDGLGNLSIAGGLTVPGGVNFDSYVNLFGTTYIKPLGTAISTSNYSSAPIQFQYSTWNGSAAVTNTRNYYVDSSGSFIWTNLSETASQMILDTSGHLITAGSISFSSGNLYNALGYYLDSGGLSVHAPSGRPSTDQWAVIDTNGSTVFQVFTGGTKVVSTLNNVVDSGSGAASFAGNVSAPTFTSSVATGTAPFTVTSTTQVNNLNAAMTNGYTFNQALQTSSSPTFNGLTINGMTSSLGGFVANSYSDSLIPIKASYPMLVGDMGTPVAGRLVFGDGSGWGFRFSTKTAANTYTDHFTISDSGIGTFTSNVTSPTFTSTVATGTAPFTVTSTTQVNNLNAALVNGYSFNQSLQTTSSPTFAAVSASTFTSTVAQGTAPFAVTSTTQVNNLNVNYVNGYSFNQALLTTSSPQFSGLTITGIPTFNNGASNFFSTANGGIRIGDDASGTNSKYLRVNTNRLSIVNSAYNAELFLLDDTGVIWLATGPTTAPAHVSGGGIWYDPSTGRLNLWDGVNNVWADPLKYA